MSVKIVFMGTPDFAVPPLTALITPAEMSAETSAEKGVWEVVAVVTQPDRPRGRGKKLTPPPVKVVAEKAGIKVLQPKTLKSEEAVADLAALKPDVMVVAAFGQILRKNVLTLPPYGCINIHASLLPRWRGAAPVTAAPTTTVISIITSSVATSANPFLLFIPASILCSGPKRHLRYSCIHDITG